MITINNKEIIGAVAGNIYRMHPYHMPEGIDKIMGHLVKTLDETPDCYGHIKETFKIFEFDDFKEFEKWLQAILEQVPEYNELNVSRELKEKGYKMKKRYHKKTSTNNFCRNRSRKIHKKFSTKKFINPI